MFRDCVLTLILAFYHNMKMLSLLTFNRSLKKRERYSNTANWMGFLSPKPVLTDLTFDSGNGKHNSSTWCKLMSTKSLSTLFIDPIHSLTEPLNTHQITDMVISVHFLRDQTLLH